MPVVICLLRGVNVGGNNQIKMDALRSLFATLKLKDAQSYIQSGNIVFRTTERDMARLAKTIKEAIGRTFGFQPEVILRTTAEMNATRANNPFSDRPGLEPSKLLVTFLAETPSPEAAAKLAAIEAYPEELRLQGRELFVYFPDGMGKSKLAASIDKGLKTAGTGRNWNTVVKLLEMAQKMESSG